jgi:hypothetical protein
VLTVVLAARIGARLGSPRTGLLAGALVALNGPVAWGFMSGADVALFMLLATWLLDRLLAGWHRADGPDRGWVSAAALLALARPEGLPAALLLGLAYVFGPGRHLRRRGGWRPWIPLAAGLAVLLLYRALTGSWVGSSVADKSVFSSYTITDAVTFVSEYGVDVIRGLLLGFYPRMAPVGGAPGLAPLFFPPLALLLALLPLALAERAQRATLRVWLGLVLALFAMVAPNIFIGVHFHRYLMWAFPSLLALTAVGLGMAARLLVRPEPDRERPVFLAVAGLFVLLGALSTARFAAVYADNAGELSRRDLAAAQWIRRNLPPGARVANLATSVEYLTGHHSINLHGVTTPAFYRNRTSEREAGTFEALGRLPVAERPPYLVSTVATQETLSTMQSLVEEPPLFRTSSFGDEIVIYRMNYDLLDRGDWPLLARTAQQVGGRAAVDRLDVCDRADEDAHGYRFRSRMGDLLLHGTPRIDEYPDGTRVGDAGRVVMGDESFTVRTQPGRELVVVRRTGASVYANVVRPHLARPYPMELREEAVEVFLDGQPAGRWAFTPGPGWDEALFRVPAALVKREHSRLELRGRYAAFTYWFYQ